MTDDLLERGIAILKGIENRTRAGARVTKSDSAEADSILEEVTGEETDNQGQAMAKKTRTVDELVEVLKKQLPDIKDPSMKAAAGQAISLHNLNKQAQDQFGGDNGAADQGGYGARDRKRYSSIVREFAAQHASGRVGRDRTRSVDRPVV